MDVDRFLSDEKFRRVKERCAPPRCRGSTRGGLSLGPPSTCYTYICDSTARLRRGSRDCRLFRDIRLRAVRHAMSPCRRDSSLYRSRRDRTRGRRPGTLRRLVEIEAHRPNHGHAQPPRAHLGGGGRDTAAPFKHPLLGRRGPPRPPWPRA